MQGLRQRGLSGLAAGLVFATAHAVLIVPIWNRIAFGLVAAAIAGPAEVPAPLSSPVREEAPHDDV